ncbi:hypothetical protein [Streptomyces sp. NPDC026673]|uniref:hypothetical protein n=1 Tax=Streptomyces sp. NPDC026673 TaxID=3155724 RepID=UPI0033D47BE8
MRRAFAHDAVVTLAPGGDERAPGAAITAALCGHWEHEPPCPLAPHHTAAAPGDGGELRLRVLFASAPDDEAEVRRRIDAALAAGGLGATHWEFGGSRPGAVGADEAARAARLSG